MGKAGIGQQPARGNQIVLGHQHAARQNSDGAFQHAHILIEHQMLDVRAIEQCADGRHQNDIVGADQFLHEARRSSPGARCDR